jgi:hypothetical protein
MGSLQEILGRPDVRAKVIADCECLIGQEVDSKGLMGIPVKMAYKVVQAVKPGFVAHVIDHLLDEFCGNLDPLYQAAVAAQEPVVVYFCARTGQVADALLAITDARATQAKNQNLKMAYNTLRPVARKHVEAAVPRIARLIMSHAAAGNV